MTKLEVLKNFGILILAMRFEFQDRRDMCSRTKPSKYRPAPCFGDTRTSRNRFDSVLSCITFSFFRAEHKFSFISTTTDAGR